MTHLYPLFQTEPHTFKMTS